MLHSLSGKVTLGLLLFVGVLISIAIGTIRTANVTEDAARHMSEITLAEARLNEGFVFRLSRTLAEITSAGILFDKEELDEAEENLAEARAILVELSNLQAGHSETEFVELNDQRQALAGHLERAIAQATTAVAAKDQQAVTEVLEDLEGVEDAIETLIVAQNAHLEEDATKTVAVVSANLRRARLTLPLQYTGIGLLAILAVWILHRLVVKPVRALAGTATAIGHGDLDQPVARGGIDEVGMLQESFAQMVERLRERDHALNAQMGETRAALAELGQRSNEQARLVAAMEQQREVILGLSVPVLPISDRVLVMPLVGALDYARQQLVQEKALQAIAQRGASTLLLDLTGVPVVDNEVAHGLLEVVQGAQLLGARVILVGIRPEVAQALVGMEFPLASIRSRGTLQSGIEEALRQEQPQLGTLTRTLGI